MALVDRLEEYRKQRRDSIGEFVQGLGITRRRYWELRKKGGHLNSAHLLRAANYLGVSPQELMRESESLPRQEAGAAVKEAPTSYLVVEPQLPLAIPEVAEGSAWATTPVAKSGSRSSDASEGG